MGTSPASPPTARKLAADGAGWNLDRVFALFPAGVLRFSGTFTELEENPAVKRAPLMI